MNLDGALWIKVQHHLAVRLSSLANGNVLCVFCNDTINSASS